MVLGNFSVSSDEQESKKIEARRQRDAARLKQFGGKPGRLRTIGADIAGLKNQIEVNLMHKSEEQQLEQSWNEQQSAIHRYMIEIASQDARTKREQLEKLKADWDGQYLQKIQKMCEQKLFDQQGIEPDACSVSAAQRFDGEDMLYKERTRIQALQIAQWLKQQEFEKNARKGEEDAENLAIGKKLLDNANQQMQLANQCQKDLASLALQIQEDNKMESQSKEARAATLAIENAEKDKQDIKYHLESQLISENPEQGKVSNPDLIKSGHSIRVDHWKGLSKQETIAVLKDNDKILQLKREQLERSNEQNQKEALEQRQWTHLLHATEFANQKRKAELQLEIKRTLDAQASQAAYRERVNTLQSKGSIASAFFQGFGTSYR